MKRSLRIKKLQLQTWLDLLCTMLPGVRQAALITDRSPIKAQPVLWPNADSDYSVLITVASLAIRQDKPVTTLAVNDDINKPASETLIAYPLHIKEKLFGAIAILIDINNEHHSTIMQLLKWGERWLELLLQQQINKPPFSLIINAFNAGFTHNSLTETATAVASSLAQELNCKRVTIGLTSGDSIEIVAMSFNANFDVRTSLFRNLKELMEKTISQRKTLLIPVSNDSAPDETLPLSPITNCSVLLINIDNPVGVLLFERAPEQFFEQETITLCEQLGHLLGPLLVSKQHSSRSLQDRVSGFFSRPKLKVLDHIFSGYKLAVLIIIAITIILSFGTGPYRVTAPATIEGHIMRVVTVPFDGYVSQALARAGQLVKVGDIIAELDTKDIFLEQRRLRGKRDEFVKQYRRALSSLNQAEIHIFKSQIEQVNAQLRLMEKNIQRAKLTSPLDGVIITGDLNRSLGAPVEKGQVLFEVAPLDKYRLILQVSEREIADIEKGQRGTLTLRALPANEIPFQIQQISPIFTEIEGRISYRVEAIFESKPAALRPGMQGIGKILIGQRSYSWLYFHKVLDATRLWIWSWLP